MSKKQAKLSHKSKSKAFTSFFYESGFGHIVLNNTQYTLSITTTANFNQIDI